MKILNILKHILEYFNSKNKLVFINCNTETPIKIFVDKIEMFENGILIFGRDDINRITTAQYIETIDKTIIFCQIRQGKIEENCPIWNPDEYAYEPLPTIGKLWKGED